MSDPAVAATAVLNSILAFDGFLRVDAPGSLFLGLGSDDGSELVIQGTQVINNDGLHAFPGAGAGPVEIAFLEAGLYETDILFFESLVVDWGIEFFEGSTGNPVSTSRLYGSIPPASQIPVPAALPLLGGALLGLWSLARRRQLAA